MPNDYAEIVDKLFTTREANRPIEDLLHALLGLQTETGELADIVKKNWIYCQEVDMENVLEELGDIEFYLEAFRQRLNVTREQTLEANKKKLAIRYKGFQFSRQRARERADKQGELEV